MQRSVLRLDEYLVAKNRRLALFVGTLFLMPVALLATGFFYVDLVTRRPQQARRTLRRVSDDTTTGVGATSDGEGTADEQLAALDLSEEERLVLAKVADIVRRISYGTVVLVIQDGKVVQIEMAEKFRLR